MTRVRWGVLGLAGAVVFAAGVWSSRGEAPGGGATSAAVTEAHANAPADLEQEVRALRAELEGLRQRQGRLEQPPPPAPQAPTPPREELHEARDTASPDEAGLAAEEQRRRERAMELEAELEVAMNTEPRDTAWAGTTEALVTESFRGQDFAGSRLTRVECRTHLCTLEVEHEGGEAQAELLTSLSRVPGLRGQTVVRPHNEAGRVTSRVYLSRAGERLPMTLRR